MLVTKIILLFWAELSLLSLPFSYSHNLYSQQLIYQSIEKSKIFRK